MIELLFNKELLLIVLVCLTMGIYMAISDWRRKKQEERQARLNSIRFPK
jgi:preprotein translocase subunit YajC